MYVCVCVQLLPGLLKLLQIYWNDASHLVLRTARTDADNKRAATALGRTDSAVDTFNGRLFGLAASLSAATLLMGNSVFGH